MVLCICLTFIISFVKDKSEKWSAYTYSLIIELSRNEKLQKYRIILPQHTNYLHKWLVHILTCLLLPWLFFFLWDSCMCKSRTTFHLLWRAGPPLHLKLSRDFLTFISFNIWRQKGKCIRSLHLDLVTLVTLEAKWSFQLLKRLLSDWFGPKYKSKVSGYMDNTKVLLRSRLNLGFKLNYFSNWSWFKLKFFIVIFVHLELIFFMLHIL